MNTKISESTSSQGLENIANKFRETMITNNDDIYQSIADEINASPSLFTKIFPTAIQKETEEMTVQRMRKLAGDKEGLMTAYLNIKLTLIQTEGDALIEASNKHLESELKAFLAKKNEETSNLIMAYRETALSKMKPHLENIEQYKDIPILYNPAKKSIDNQIENYMNTLDELVNGSSKYFKVEPTNTHQFFGK